MPLLFAGASIERHQGVPVQVVPNAIRAVKIGGRGAERGIYDPALHVDGEEAPDVGPRSILPGAGGPGLRSRLARPRHGVKSPEELARLSIPGANITVSAGTRRTLAIAAAG